MHMRPATATLIPAWALALYLMAAAAALGQPLLEAPETPWCEVLLPEPPDGPRSVHDYSLVPVPEGSKTTIGILFVYTDDLYRADVKRRTEAWIEKSNSLLSRGTTGLQLESVGLLPAPGPVSAIWERGTVGSILLAELEAHTELPDSAITLIRERLGGDLVLLAAGTTNTSGAGVASLWPRDWTPDEFRPYSVSAVGVGSTGQPAWREAQEGWTIFLHEVGHNLGLHHDIGNIEATGRLHYLDLLWSRTGLGYEYNVLQSDYLEDEVGTIMAAGDTDLAGFSNGGSRLLPLLDGVRPRRGWPTHFVGGDAGADAEAALRLTIGAAAAFYEKDDDYNAAYNDGYDEGYDEGHDEGYRRGYARGVRDGRDSGTLNPHAHGTDADLHGGGFTVAARFENDGWSSARVHPASIGDAGAGYYFFDESNPELLVKVLDGCAINGHYWLFASAATDLNVSLRVTRRWPPSSPDDDFEYEIPGGSFGLARIGDERLACEGGHGQVRAAAPPGAGIGSAAAFQGNDGETGAEYGNGYGDGLEDAYKSGYDEGRRRGYWQAFDGWAVSRNNVRPEAHLVSAELQPWGGLGRFRVSARFDNDGWTQAKVHPAHFGNEAVAMYFFDQDNPELLVKILDGCAINGSYWLYVSAATDLDSTVRVVRQWPSLGVDLDVEYEIPGGTFGLVRIEEEHMVCRD